MNLQLFNFWGLLTGLGHGYLQRILKTFIISNSDYKKCTVKLWIFHGAKFHSLSENQKIKPQLQTCHVMVIVLNKLAYLTREIVKKSLATQDELHRSTFQVADSVERKALANLPLKEKLRKGRLYWTKSIRTRAEFAKSHKRNAENKCMIVLEWSSQNPPGLHPFKIWQLF